MTKKTECRHLQIILLSASNLPNVRSFGEMKVYAEISIDGVSGTKKRTETDKERGTNPIWVEAATYMISESSVRKPELKAVVKLYCARTLGDKFIGQVIIPIKNLLDLGLRSQKPLSCDVSDTENGTLDFSYNFGDVFVAPKPSSGDTAAVAIFGLKLIEVAGELLAN